MHNQISRANSLSGEPKWSGLISDRGLKTEVQLNSCLFSGVRSMREWFQLLSKLIEFGQILFLSFCFAHFLIKTKLEWELKQQLTQLNLLCCLVGRTAIFGSCNSLPKLKYTRAKFYVSRLILWRQTQIAELTAKFSSASPSREPIRFILEARSAQSKQRWCSQKLVCFKSFIETCL